MTVQDAAPANAPQHPLGPYSLGQLPFAYDAFEPDISNETIRLQRNVVHEGYVQRVNALLERNPQWLGLTIETVLRRIEEVPEPLRTELANEAGGHANHQFFWKVLTPRPTRLPQGELGSAIDREFGSFETMKERFEQAALAVRGSGWAFLSIDPKSEFRPVVLALPDNESVLPLGLPGLIICDLWEHAFIGDHGLDRVAWLKCWWRFVNWPYVEERYVGIRSGIRHL